MTISVDGIRNFKVYNLMDYSGDWGITFNKDEDWISTDWTSNIVSNLRNSIERYASDIDSHDVLPSFRDLNINMSMEKTEAEGFNNTIVSPTKCIEIFDKYSILSKASEKKMNIITNYYTYTKTGKKVFISF